jgi:hypothetical protein
MALSDFEAFLRERLALLDETRDVSPGSEADRLVIQPALRRIGSDPFSIDFVPFVQDRLNAEFPDMATKEGDATTDLLIKPAEILLDPVLREIRRIKGQQSFKDPDTLAIDEAAALGANLFAEPAPGDFARGVGRIYFASPQSVTVTPANFGKSKGGLRFFPSARQAIRLE